MSAQASLPDYTLLLEELAALPPGEPVACTIRGHSRYQSLELARLLTDRGMVAQPERLEESEELAAAAIQVCAVLTEQALAQQLHGEAIRGIDSVTFRATCLFGNSCRLRGAYDRAERFFLEASHFDGLPADTASFLRGLGLLRWEQGRTQEAIALLSRARELFRDLELTTEAVSTTQLLLLLQAELGQLEAAAELFSSLEPESTVTRPWLSARAALTATFCLVPRPGNEARTALLQGGSFKALVQHDDELALLSWLESRARARLGDLDGVETTLLKLYRHFDKALDIVPAMLVLFDLLALRGADGPNFSGLLKHLTQQRQVEVALTLYRREVDPTAGNLWEQVTSLGAWFRLKLRRAGHPVTYLPFV